MIYTPTTSVFFRPTFNVQNLSRIRDLHLGSIPCKYVCRCMLGNGYSSEPATTQKWRCDERQNSWKSRWPNIAYTVRTVANIFQVSNMEMLQYLMNIYACHLNLFISESAYISKIYIIPYIHLKFDLVDFTWDLGSCCMKDINLANAIHKIIDARHNKKLLSHRCYITITFQQLNVRCWRHAFALLSN